ncbi:dTDP-4-dehydrorhamnose reductase [Gordonia jinhuaensis]|uniref:dTDP-4-dehydrorhamnose reductase n=1 Tax=Gordonia jinhuaensis TaxID=1517702 RepID=A0A916SW82_9ACTN|nr:dTDP-4-dehydrorhamnose reductase [Gordonia jinhuaensis]GGB16532.1 NAD(P)-dependent oxidoreductase [Gordonia jinhuaensis]
MSAGAVGETPTPTIYVTGARGQLGRQVAARSPWPVRAFGSGELDISDPDSVRSGLAALTAGDVVINCAAHTQVDAAESDPDGAAAVNTAGPRLLAEQTRRSGAWLIHVSTDYVFDGRATRPYEPDDADGVTPASVYGRTKRDGELAARATDPRTTIVRTAWVYTGTPANADFVSTMRRLEQTRDQVRVVDDQRGSPTYTVDLAQGLLELATTPGEGRIGAILHATNAGSCTWFELARAVFAEVGADPARVQPCTTEEFPRPAPRPSYSVLSNRSWSQAGLTPLREWQAALHAAIAAAPAESGTLGDSAAQR